MSDIALRTVGLGKMYRIGGERESYRTLRDTLAQAAKRPLERIRHPGAATYHSEELWALRYIDLEVKHGEALGIIGGNGAGKSTLLKVLSRITEPTEGRVEVRGRVASLLEVGTGFHPELTGRENIQLNGAILGMPRTEIRSKFDEIVEFSGIGRFLDTPVKRYSSGMYVRLAFAVAAHLEPEILIVDEVLAVGDAAFQKKCLGKMEEVAGHGRTVLFVSHNMGAVSTLCDRAIVLSDGRIHREGRTDQVIEAYLRAGLGSRFTSVDIAEDPSLRLQILHAELVDAVDDRGNDVIEFHCKYLARTELENTLLCVDVRNGTDLCVFYSNDYLLGGERHRAPGVHSVLLTIPKYLLTPGHYTVGFSFWEPGRPPEHTPPQRLSFHRAEAPNRLSAHGSAWPGCIYMPDTWTYLGREGEKQPHERTD